MDKLLIILIMIIEELLRCSGRRNAPIKSCFRESGPTHITSIDWNNMNDRTAVLASLVQGVYVMEEERQYGILPDDPESNAKPWWESFNFTLIKTLQDPDGAIFGAVFDYTGYRKTCELNPSPRQVMAFRGTLLKNDSWISDFILDLRAFLGTLNKSRRFMLATEEIENSNNIADVWVAGHSLGAAVALLIGKNMARSGFPLVTHLFNPPFLSIPIEKLVKNKLLKHVLRLNASLFKAGLAKIVKYNHHDHEIEDEESCRRLASWGPYLYLNKSDWFCAEYIGYFKHRDFMSKVGAAKIEKTATKYSGMNQVIMLYQLFQGRSSPQGPSSEPLHVLPSAYVTINDHKSQCWLSSHKLGQWYHPKNTTEFQLYQFNQ